MSVLDNDGLLSSQNCPMEIETGRSLLVAASLLLPVELLCQKDNTSPDRC
jgi:hypothetical protein